MQCSLLFHLVAQLLKFRRIGFLHKHFLVLLLQKGMLHKGSLLFTHIFFLKWALNRRFKVPIFDITALTAFLRTDSSRLAGYSSFSSKTVNRWSYSIGERSSTALLIDTLSRAMRPQTNTNLSLAESGVGQEMASSPVAVNLSSGHLVCVLDPHD
jgi:hypothetical protein